jgi:hypothetical protein
MPEQLVKAVPEPRGLGDRSLERVADEIVKAAVTGIEQVENFDARRIFFKVPAALFAATPVNNL